MKDLDKPAVVLVHLQLFRPSVIRGPWIMYGIFSCSSFYSVNFFQGTSQCVVQRLTNSTRGYSVLGFLIVFFKYSMAHGDLRFLNGRAGRGNNTVIVCIIQAKLYVGMYVFQICNIFHNLDSSFYPIWTSCKVLFQKQMGQI